MSYNRLGNINRSKVISNVEYLFHNASGIQKESIDFRKWDNDPDDMSNKEVRILEPRQLSLAADLKNATQKFLKQSELSIKSSRKRKINDYNEDKLLSNLSQDSSILITRPDKGRGVVVLDREYYVEKLDAILSDNKKFKLLSQDPTISRENWSTSVFETNAK